MIRLATIQPNVVRKMYVIKITILTEFGKGGVPRVIISEWDKKLTPPLPSYNIVHGMEAIE